MAKIYDMKTSDEHNKEYMEHFKEMNNYPKKSNLECPKCSKEMSYIDNIVLLTYPPKKQVQCLSCGYTAYVYV